ncbi:MAG: T9SS type A sorting domain-containing protein [Fluviicola sp.]|nr:T9SS type A sorting domain-containing protein [Fluviicola sp.]
MKRYLIFLFVGFSLHWQVAAQANLVPNPGFEDTLFCPLMTLNNPTGGAAIKDWYSPNTPAGLGFWYHYFNCFYTITPGLEYIYMPHNGNGEISLAIVSIDTNKRQYAQCQLVDSMRHHETYYVSYFVKSFFQSSMCVSNGTSIHFSDTAIIRSIPFAESTYQFFSPGFFDLPASVTSFQEEIISDTNLWVKIEGVYEAHGGEQFITLGNFKRNHETNCLYPIPTLVGKNNRYFYDDITVMHIDSLEKPLVAYAGPDTTIHILDSVFIGRKISNLNCNWYELNGPLIASNTSGIVVQPLVNTTYVVEQILANQLTYDTVTVFVIGGVGIAENSGNNSVTISPNPNKGTFQLHVQQYEEQITVAINDVNGTNVYSSTLAPEQAIVQLPENIADGVYFVRVSTAENSLPMVTKMIVNRVY